MCAQFGTIVTANNDLARGRGRNLWITLYSYCLSYLTKGVVDVLAGFMCGPQVH